MTVFDEVVEIMYSARKALAFTGAGISRESGLPTYRDIDGDWSKYDPMTFATLDGFLSNPVLVWKYFRMRQKQIEDTTPNPGHVALAEYEKYYPDFLLFTQNVDNLHERAGSKNVIKIHGDAFSVKCLECNAKYKSKDLNLPMEFTDSNLPRCSICECLCRPDIVWFGEYIESDYLNTAYNYVESCDFAVSIGTSGEVSGGYGLMQAVFQRGKNVIEINPRPTALTNFCTHVIREPSGIVLPKLLKAVLDIQ